MWYPNLAIKSHVHSLSISSREPGHYTRNPRRDENERGTTEPCLVVIISADIAPELREKCIGAKRRIFTLFAHPRVHENDDVCT